MLLDRETGSLWAQLLGESIKGEKENSRLELYPSSLTTYANFKELYPNGLLLKKEGRGLPNSNYEQYFRDRTKLGIFGRVDKYRRLNGKEMVIGIRNDQDQTAVAIKLLKRKHLIIVEKATPPLLITYDDSTKSASVFSLERFDKKSIKSLKYKDGMIISGNSEKSWNAFTGAPSNDEFAQLQELPFTTCYWFAWITFFPETSLRK